jgi:SPP1 family predicted phage head-tail adaptor
MISAGELNKQIIIQAKTITRNTYNEPIAVWEDLATPWANIITTGGKEYYAAQKLNAETSAVFKIRYRRISTLNRIKYGNRIFEILSISDPEEKHFELLLSCKEVI